MSHSVKDLFNLRVPCDSTAPAAARRALDGCEAVDQIREDAKLVASELVTNAVLHSGCQPGETLEVRATLAGSGVRISVHDPGAGTRRVIRDGSDPANGGFGLRVIRRLARKSGSERLDGHGVWAEVAFAV